MLVASAVLRLCRRSLLQRKAWSVVEGGQLPRGSLQLCAVPLTNAVRLQLHTAPRLHEVDAESHGKRDAKNRSEDTSEKVRKRVTRKRSIHAVVGGGKGVAGTRKGSARHPDPRGPIVGALASPDTRNSSDLLLQHLMQRSKSPALLQDILATHFEEFPSEVKIHHVNYVLKGLVMKQDAKKATHLFKNMHRLFNVRPDTASFNAMIELSLSTNRVQRANMYYDQLVAARPRKSRSSSTNSTNSTSSPRPDQVTFGLFLSHAARHRKIVLANTYLKRMERARCAMDDYIQNAVIRLDLHALPFTTVKAKVERALGIASLLQLEVIGDAADDAADVLTKFDSPEGVGDGRGGHQPRRHLRLADTPAYTVPFTATTFTQLLRAAKYERDQEFADALFQVALDHARSHVHPVRLDIFFVNTCIDVFGSFGMVDRLQTLVELMGATELSPNGFTYSKLLSSFVAVRDVQRALTSLQEMDKVGFQPSTAELCLVAGLCFSIDEHRHRGITLLHDAMRHFGHPHQHAKPPANAFAALTEPFRLPRSHPHATETYYRIRPRLVERLAEVGVKRPLAPAALGSMMLPPNRLAVDPAATSSATSADRFGEEAATDAGHLEDRGGLGEENTAAALDRADHVVRSLLQEYQKGGYLVYPSDLVSLFALYNEHFLALRESGACDDASDAIRRLLSLDLPQVIYPSFYSSHGERITPEEATRPFLTKVPPVMSAELSQPNSSHSASSSADCNRLRSNDVDDDDMAGNAKKEPMKKARRKAHANTEKAFQLQQQWLLTLSSVVEGWVSFLCDEQRFDLIMQLRQVLYRTLFSDFGCVDQAVSHALSQRDSLVSDPQRVDHTMLRHDVLLRDFLAPLAQVHMANRESSGHVSAGKPSVGLQAFAGIGPSMRPSLFGGFGQSQPQAQKKGREKLTGLLPFFQKSMDAEARQESFSATTTGEASAAPKDSGQENFRNKAKGSARPAPQPPDGTPFPLDAYNTALSYFIEQRNMHRCEQLLTLMEETRTMNSRTIALLENLRHTFAPSWM